VYAESVTYVFGLRGGNTNYGGFVAMMDKNRQDAGASDKGVFGDRNLRCKFLSTGQNFF